MNIKTKFNELINEYPNEYIVIKELFGNIHFQVFTYKKDAEVFYKNAMAINFNINVKMGLYQLNKTDLRRFLE